MSNFILATAAQTEPSQLIMLPFAVLLLAVALLPVVLKRHWERYYHLVALFLAAVTTGYYLFGIRQPKRILHEAGDYIHFMALVGSLFVVAGGIHVQIRGRATPFFNCVLLFLGTIAGNVLGTIGASMLFIRPWIRVNKYRYTGLHTAFFIFLVSNLGGGLTPMGPPLFLGYLKGVPFWWIVQHCWLAWSVALLSLLLTFYLVDRHNFRRAPTIVGEEESGAGKIRIDGLRNIFFLAIILGALFVERPPFLREAVMLGAAVGSYFATPKSVHAANEFSFAPAKEVGWLFLGIFLTMVPVLDYMQLHARDLAIDTPAKFYWITGGLSAVLDNAPTYLSFLANALGRIDLSIENPAAVHEFLGSGKAEMVAISMGAVLFGAATYIGNSPNFMIKAIAEQHGMHTPSFIGFVLKFSLPILLPILLLVYWVILGG
ncbi:MAG: sodium:proton antiporter [Verrucomicrobia bacterium]|nr:MAG: sodium:proton antiporter [Verrucomicrobiota bacterium]PYJ53745.1 MAG: sodium:proton antiporter [Verrucomicrobiota bacterium]